MSHDETTDDGGIAGGERPAIVDLSRLDGAGREKAAAAAACLSGGLADVPVCAWVFAGFGEDSVRTAAEFDRGDPAQLKTLAFSLTAAAVAVDDHPDYVPLADAGAQAQVMAGLERARKRTAKTLGDGNPRRAGRLAAAALRRDGLGPWRSWIVCALDGKNRALPVMVMPAKDRGARRDDGETVMRMALETLALARKAEIAPPSASRDGDGVERGR